MGPLRAILLLAAVFVVGIGAASAGADPFTPRRASDRGRPTSRFEDFAERRRLEASLELRALSRDADRRAEERRLGSEGSRADLERYRQRTRAEDDLDRLVARHEVDALAPVAGFESFGPETRRLLERSHIELRWIERRQELEQRLHQLEREVAGREPASGSPFRPSPGLGD
jgi:hypothetical protein